MATLGELLFYIATQQQDGATGSQAQQQQDAAAAWGITGNTFAQVGRGRGGAGRSPQGVPPGLHAMHAGLLQAEPGSFNQQPAFRYRCRSLPGTS